MTDRLDADLVPLPTPQTSGGLSLTEALQRRRSVREFTNQRLSLEELSQLCWAGQGVTSPQGFRTAPSAGGILPFTLLVATPDGLFAYEPAEHRLRRQVAKDVRPELQAGSLDQECVGAAPAVFVLVAELLAMRAKYAGRAEFYVTLEAGHIAQNLLLQATALGLGGVPVGAFHERLISVALHLPAVARPLYLVPIGHPAG